MKKFFFFVWGLPQNIIGLFAYFILKRYARKEEKYKDSVVLFFNKNLGAVSLGIFIFVFSDYGYQEDYVVRHEYGHSIQSKILGPLYLLVIGLPSIIWAGCFDKYRTKKGISYYDFFPEKWANKLGGN